MSTATIFDPAPAVCENQAAANSLIKEFVKKLALVSLEDHDPIATLHELCFASVFPDNAPGTGRTMLPYELRPFFNAHRDPNTLNIVAVSYQKDAKKRVPEDLVDKVFEIDYILRQGHREMYQLARQQKKFGVSTMMRVQTRKKDAVNDSLLSLGRRCNIKGWHNPTAKIMVNMLNELVATPSRIVLLARHFIEYLKEQADSKIKKSDEVRDLFEKHADGKIPLKDLLPCLGKPLRHAESNIVSTIVGAEFDFKSPFAVLDQLSTENLTLPARYDVVFNSQRFRTPLFATEEEYKNPKKRRFFVTQQGQAATVIPISKLAEYVERRNEGGAEPMPEEPGKRNLLLNNAADVAAAEEEEEPNAKRIRLEVNGQKVSALAPTSSGTGASSSGVAQGAVNNKYTVSVISCSIENYSVLMSGTTISAPNLIEAMHSSNSYVYVVKNGAPVFTYYLPPNQRKLQNPTKSYQRKNIDKQPAEDVMLLIDFTAQKAETEGPNANAEPTSGASLPAFDEEDDADAWKLD
jgi:hypothetical protein